MTLPELPPAPITETPLDLATKCDTAECQLPYCFCSKDESIQWKTEESQRMCRPGHFLPIARIQIATGTVSQQQGLQDKGYEEWAGEMIGMREILKKFANVSRAEIFGGRATATDPRVALHPGLQDCARVQIGHLPDQIIPGLFWQLATHVTVT
ncbi:Chitin deacetylase 4 [Operophtera brumata]|uniref:Chitin deacetylase 4 n=1 Tax=Operophtera brumata TaxID=104452 RepID=A0A0L7KVY1_OPEBR|nr:Chitin deacetylase 4 [Operophtera brumata]